MTVTAGLKVPFSQFDNVQQCREFVESKDKDKKSFLTLTDCGALGKYVLPLVDRWLSDYPGRVFVSAQSKSDAIDENEDLELMNDEDAIRQRLPEARPDVCWSGGLVVGNELKGRIMIYNPIKVDRLPRSEFLFVLSSVTEDQWASIPSGTNRGILCAVETLESCPDLNNCVLIAPEESDCSLYLLTKAPKNATKGLKRLSPKSENEYLMRPIPSLSLFSDLYKAASADIARVAPIHHPHYLRTLGLGAARLGRSRPDDIETVITRKHLNALRSIDKIEELIFPFFQKFEKKSILDKSDNSSNFESLAVQKRLRKLTETEPSQKSINGIFKSISEEDGTIEDHVYSGKRLRRLLGTTYNSHKWAHSPNEFQPVDAPLASEVIGSL